MGKGRSTPQPIVQEEDQEDSEEDENENEVSGKGKNDEDEDETSVTNAALTFDGDDSGMVPTMFPAISFSMLATLLDVNPAVQGISFHTLTASHASTQYSLLTFWHGYRLRRWPAQRCRRL